MISFMVLGGPRSATSWMANLLTTDATLCFHDPLLGYTKDQLTTLHLPGKKYGISCTSSLSFPEWVISQKCPKVLLYRDVVEINRSLAVLGLDLITPSSHMLRMGSVEAPIYKWNEVFKMHVAAEICKHLGVPFDEHRHWMLRAMNVQPMWAQVPFSREAVNDYQRRFVEACDLDELRELVTKKLETR